MQDTVKRPGHSGTRHAASRLTAVLIIIEPVGHRGRFRARLVGGGRIISRSSRQPFLDAARVLVAEGHSPCAVLETRRPGASDWDLRAPLFVAAAFDVRETPNGPAFRPFIAPQSLLAVPPIVPDQGTSFGANTDVVNQ
jgi:hypothetical protein